MVWPSVCGPTFGVNSNGGTTEGSCMIMPLLFDLSAQALKPVHRACSPGGRAGQT